MGFRIENIAIDAERFLVVAKEQVKIFQRLSQEEWLHHIAQLGLCNALHIAQWAVTMFYAGKFLKGL